MAVWAADLKEIPEKLLVFYTNRTLISVSVFSAGVHILGQMYLFHASPFSFLGLHVIHCVIYAQEPKTIFILQVKRKKSKRLTFLRACYMFCKSRHPNGIW